MLLGIYLLLCSFSRITWQVFPEGLCHIYSQVFGNLAISSFEKARKQHFCSFWASAYSIQPTPEGRGRGQWESMGKSSGQHRKETFCSHFVIGQKEMIPWHWLQHTWHSLFGTNRELTYKMEHLFHFKTVGQL